jgi:hypothetical protein
MGDLKVTASVRKRGRRKWEALVLVANPRSGTARSSTKIEPKAELDCQNNLKQLALAAPSNVYGVPNPRKLNLSALASSARPAPRSRSPAPRTSSPTSASTRPGASAGSSCSGADSRASLHVRLRPAGGRLPLHGATGQRRRRLPRSAGHVLHLRPAVQGLRPLPLQVHRTASRPGARSLKGRGPAPRTYMFDCRTAYRPNMDGPERWR